MQNYLLKILKSRNEETERGSVPTGRRVYAVGDIHGRADLLDKLWPKISGHQQIMTHTKSCITDGSNSQQTKDPQTDIERGDPNATGLKKSDTPHRQYIFLGDYIDRGPNSYGVIERLITIARTEPSSIFLKGNHERAMLDFLRIPEDNADWLDWGGLETMRSYGIRPNLTDSVKDIAKRFASSLPSEHLAFFENLKPFYEVGDYFFVHAGVRPGIPLTEQKEDDLLWIRQEFHNTPQDQRPDKIIVHGHHPVKKPLDAGWRIAIDTGAVWTGRLTAVLLEGGTRRFISTNG